MFMCGGTAMYSVLHHDCISLNLPETTANVQINAIDPIARPFVDT